MIKKTGLFLFAFILGFLHANAETDERGSIQGRIYDAKNNEPIPFANIVIWQTNIGTTSDFDGNFLITGIKPGYIELRASAVGYKAFVSGEILITNARRVNLDIALEEAFVEIDEVTVKVSPFRRREESPVSIQRIGIAEIEKNPGGNRDISRVIQSFPGVSSSPNFRNDVIVRGGGPTENRFYIDEVEIPNLNHFATQGASGGPVGIINVDFLREAELYSGAFPANRGNALSSVLEMKQVDGNPDKLQFRSSLGASDLALTLDGPLSPSTTFILSARRSYLQLLFGALGLPFLPTYNDFQFKSRTKIDDKREITFIGLGAIDQFALNTSANETDDQRYILSYVPVNEQWNYTVGAVYKRYRESNYDTWVLSRNYLNNVAYKYEDNIEVDSLKLLDYSSAEIENKFRYENTSRFGNGYKLNVGAGLEYARLKTSAFNRVFIDGQPAVFDFFTNLDLFKWSLFGQISRNFMNDKLSLSFGLRADANSYASSMSNMFEQISPRFSASWGFTPDWWLNFSTGRFYQQPAYTIMGFRNVDGVMVNKNNNLTYIRADHIVAGLEWRPSELSRVTLEGFYKDYGNYPFSVADSVPMASKGADFGVFGSEEVRSISDGRSFGLELLLRHRLFKGFNTIASYTYVRSEFEDLQGKFIPTAWDNRHIFNITATKSFKRNWDFGFKWRFVGGYPFTPIDFDKSGLIQAWDVNGREYLDFSRFNSQRLGAFHQLDIRVDKQYFLREWSLLFYLDIQNLYNFKSEEPDRLVREVDASGSPLIDPMDPNRYVLRTIERDGSGTILPTVGIIIEF
jgi:outer membrane receptor for ferrienterochelin and colicin